MTAPGYPVDRHLDTPAGSPVYMVIRVASGALVAAHESAHGQGEVIERGLTFGEALARANPPLDPCSGSGAWLGMYYTPARILALTQARGGEA